MQILRRYGVVWLLAALAAGCSSTNSEVAAKRGDTRVSTSSQQCQWNRSACIYKGRYEMGERGYAEEEARRLNQASVERLRRIR